MQISKDSRNKTVLKPTTKKYMFT